MATAVLSSPNLHDGRTGRRQRALGRLLIAALLTTLTLFALAIHGYHPYVEDGGLYLAGVKYLLHPELYAADRPFVTAHLHYSIFAPLLAASVRHLHLSLDRLTLVGYVASFAALLGAAWLLAAECFTLTRERVGAVLLLACWMTLPVAGTSLMLMDPYFTARSISTPAVVLLVAAALRLSRWRRGTPLPLHWVGLAGVGAVIAASVHPLMAAYGISFATLVLVLAGRASARTRRRSGLAAGVLGTIAFTVAWLIERTAPAETADYARVVLTRSYWFLSQWCWYEIVGLIAPLVLLAAAAWLSPRSAARTLARAGIVASLCAVAIATAFAHAAAPTHAVARLQPLRVLQIIYVVMILLLGGGLGRWVLQAKPWRYAVAGLLLGAPLFAADRGNFPSSPHFEVGWAAGRDAPSGNPWADAFTWVREHTPPGAVVALDRDYISRAGEDAQSFRAIAERSTLPDAAKDGGEASITPALAGAWMRGQAAGVHLDAATDAERLARLAPLAVNYIVLSSPAATSFPCSYDNGRVKVCRLPLPGH